MLLETLDSVLNQTYSNWECIVVDDGSTDETSHLIKEYCLKDARFQYHHRPKNRLKGGNAARNYGFEMSKGDYVNWFDSDDIMLPNKIELKLQLLLNSSCDFVVCKGAIYENLPAIDPIPWPLHLGGNIIFNHVCGRIAFVTNGPLFKKDFLLQNMPLYNESLLIRQEWEFFNRLLITKPKIEVIKKPLYLFRMSQSGIRRGRDVLKIKCKIEAERLTFLNLKNKNCLNNFEDYQYRKIMIRRCITFYSAFQSKDRFKELFFTLSTIFLAIDFNFLKTHLQEKYKS